MEDLRSRSLRGWYFLVLAASLLSTAVPAQQARKSSVPELVPQMGADKACVRAAFSPDGRFIVTTALNGTKISGTTLQVWETATGRLVRDLRMRPAAYSSILYEWGDLGFSPNGKYVALFEHPPARKETASSPNALLVQKILSGHPPVSQVDFRPFLQGH